MNFSYVQFTKRPYNRNIQRSPYSIPFNKYAILTGEDNAVSLGQRLNYAVKTGKLINPRKGIYAKPGYNPQEIACLLYTPSYISFEYVLQKEGIIFQYDSRITMASNLSRTIEIEGQELQYRKIKGAILVDTIGIRRENNTNIATKERAFLDVMYLNTDYYFDHIDLLDQDELMKIIPIYRSERMIKRLKKMLQYV